MNKNKKSHVSFYIDEENYVNIHFEYDSIEDMCDIFHTIFQSTTNGEMFTSIFNNILKSGPREDAEVFLNRYKAIVDDVIANSKSKTKNSNTPLIKPSQFS